MIVELERDILVGMAGGESIIDSFRAHPSEKLVCAFEYMEPGYIWDERNVIFLSQDGDEVYLYHYIDEEINDAKEVAELRAAYDFFKTRGIELTEWPVQVIPPPMGSRVLYPPRVSSRSHSRRWVKPQACAKRLLRLLG